MEEINYYELLGVNKNASLDELWEGLKDKIGESLYEEDELKKVKALLEAYAVLSNPDNRACYDLNELIKNNESTESFALFDRATNFREEYTVSSPETADDFLRFLEMLSHSYCKIAINNVGNCDKDYDNLDAIMDLIDTISNTTIVNSPKDGFIPRKGIEEND